MNRLIALAALALLAASSTTVSAATYHVGNSLTWDALYSSNPLAGSTPTFPARGYHIRCGGNLPYIWANQQDVCTTSPAPYGMIGGLDDNAWEAVTIQPYLGSTLAADATTIDAMIDLARENEANDKTPFYVYATWPQLPWGPYQDVWTANVVDADETPMIQQRGYYDALYSRVDAATDATLRYVPSGEVLYQLSLLVAAGELPGVTSMRQFYRDDLHLGNLGQYVTATTMFATIDKINPADVWPVLPASVSVGPEVDYEAINRVILATIVSDARTGLADFNDDGLINSDDLALWTTGDLRADGTLDGVVDGQDFLLWQRFAQVEGVVIESPVEPPVELASVPEPASIVMILASMAAAGLCRRGL
jgi:hypothetical protein